MASPNLVLLCLVSHEHCDDIGRCKSWHLRCTFEIFGCEQLVSLGLESVGHVGNPFRVKVKVQF
jgi:hypothetical protein